MNNSKTPKIVVGVGLVAVYAAGLTFLTLRETHDSAVAQSAPSAQMVAAPAAPPLVIPESVETPALAPEASPPAATPAPVAPPSVASQPKPRAAEVPVASLPTRPPARSDAEESSRSNSGSNVVSELPPTADTVVSESVTSAADHSSDQDSQSTTEVPELPTGN